MSSSDFLRSGDPAQGHQARVGKTLKDSQPWWPPRPERKGPNIVFILLDDLGFSDFGCYGSEILTPHIDALAAGGMQYTQYTTVPMCTPARAALMTGKNPHAVGCGWLTHSLPGYPGYQAGAISPDAPTLPELLRDAGYGTYGVGKWHNTPDHQVTSGGDKSSWPLQRGFDRFYGFLGAETNFFSPGHLIEGNEFVAADAYPEGYYSTEDWTQRALQYLRGHTSNDPERPFFLYLAHNAPHVPLQARPQDIARYDGVYDAGWDALREARFERQKRAGLIPRDWELGAAAPGIPAWKDIPEVQRPLMARYMQIYAAMVEAIDRSVGDICAELQRLGLWENTLVVLTSDNGASSIGGPTGSANIFEKRVTQKENPELAANMLRAGTLGDIDSYPAYPVAWAQTSNTPFRFYKRTPMNGGIRVPFLMHWPQGIRGGQRCSQWVHATDLLPTVLDLLQMDYPKQHRGYATRGLDGLSFLPTFQNASSPGSRDRQYYELEGHRGYRLGHWKAVSLQPPGQPIELDRWMLFNLEQDPTECHDLSAKQPEKLAELVAAFEADADRFHVYPLDNRDNRRVLAVPDPLREWMDSPRDFWAGSEVYSPIQVSPLVADRDYRLLCDFDWTNGQSGVLFAMGDSFLGMAARVQDNRLELIHRAAPTQARTYAFDLTAGSHTLELIHRATGQRQGHAQVILSGVWLGNIDVSPTFLRFGGEGLDLGRDRKRKVFADTDPNDPQTFEGRVYRVRIEPGPQAPGSPVNRLESLAQLD